MTSDTDRSDPAPGAASRRAVAVAYDRGRDSAPRVVASGRGAIADRIREMAEASGVTVRQDADLVEVLGALEVGAEIPVEAFVAVAELLSFVYRANGRMDSAGRWTE